MEKNIEMEGRESREKMIERMLIVEDTPAEMERAKEVLEGEKECAGTLAEALRKLEKNPDRFDVLVTDLFYPTGPIKDGFKKRFFQLLGSAIEDCFFSRGDQLSGHFKRDEIKDYVKTVKDGSADEVPSGALLGLYAFLKHGIIPIWITSKGHHSSKSDFMTWLIRGGELGYEVIDTKNFIESGKEGSDSNELKRWDEVRTLLSNPTNIPPREKIMETVETIKQKGINNPLIVQLALRLPMYFEMEEKSSK